MEVMEAPTGTVVAGSEIRVSAALKGARSIALYQNRRRVARIRGESGTMAIKTKTLGAGPVRLQPAGLLGGKRVWGPVLRFKLVRPDRAASAE